MLGTREEALFRVLCRAWARPGPGWLVVQSMRTREAAICASTIKQSETVWGGRRGALIEGRRGGGHWTLEKWGKRRQGQRDRRVLFLLSTGEPWDWPTSCWAGPETVGTWAGGLWTDDSSQSAFRFYRPSQKSPRSMKDLPALLSQMKPRHVLLPFSSLSVRECPCWSDR